MLFCLQEAILFVMGRDPIIPGVHHPRWWPVQGSRRQVRPRLATAKFEGKHVKAASLTALQMRRNLFGKGSWHDSPVRADGMRIPRMMVLPLEALRKR